jgi:hypothetical protein
MFAVAECEYPFFATSDLTLPTLKSHMTKATLLAAYRS